jgi:nucleotide-binding universal stress UspA family protein
MKILVATDGSRAARAAVRFAAEMASTCRSKELILLTVAERRLEGVGLFPKAAALSTLLQMQDGLRANKILATAARELHAVKANVRRRYVRPRRGESVAQTILRKAREEGVDLIVAGSEGRGAIRQWVLGGVAQRLISTAARPVTLVSAREGKEPKPKSRR